MADYKQAITRARAEAERNARVFEQAAANRAARGGRRRA